MFNFISYKFIHYFGCSLSQDDTPRDLLKNPMEQNRPTQSFNFLEQATRGRTIERYPLPIPSHLIVGVGSLAVVIKALRPFPQGNYYSAVDGIVISPYVVIGTFWSSDPFRFDPVPVDLTTRTSSTRPPASTHPRVRPQVVARPPRETIQEEDRVLGD